MSALDIIDAVWRCVGILLLIAETVLIGCACIGVPLIWGKLDKINGALRCIDIDLAAIHGDLKKPENRRQKNDEH